jgi:hypothetical protein
MDYCRSQSERFAFTLPVAFDDRNTESLTSVERRRKGQAREGRRQHGWSRTILRMSAAASTSLLNDG